MQSGRQVPLSSPGARHWREFEAEGGNDPEGGRAPGGAGATKRRKNEIVKKNYHTIRHN